MLTGKASYVAMNIIGMAERLRAVGRFFSVKRPVELLLGDYACNSNVASRLRVVILLPHVWALCLQV
jgi:hypothetical protein